MGVWRSFQSWSKTRRFHAISRHFKIWRFWKICFEQDQVSRDSNAWHCRCLTTRVLEIIRWPSGFMSWEANRFLVFNFSIFKPWKDPMTTISNLGKIQFFLPLSTSSFSSWFGSLQGWVPPRKRRRLNGKTSLCGVESSDVAWCGYFCLWFWHLGVRFLNWVP